MNKHDFDVFLKEKVRVLDGAMGTQMQKCGLDIRHDLTETWILEHKDDVAAIQKAYIDAGSDMILAPTFQTNSIKLKGTVYATKLAQTIQEIVDITKSVCKDDTVIVGDLSCFGVLLDSASGYSFDECVNVYKEQIINLINAGVDVLCLETIIDIAEARAFAIAINEINEENKYGEYAYYTTFSFDENGKLLSGTDAKTAYYIMKDLGISAIGINCGMGPDKMQEPILALSQISDLPLIVKANAGLPIVDGAGKATFDMSVEKFISYTQSFLDMGVAVIGGCCGTTEVFINALKGQVDGVKPKILKNVQENIVASPRSYINLDDEGISIGEVDISSGDIDYIVDSIFDEMDKDIIKLVCHLAADISIDNIINEVQSLCAKALIFDFSDEKMYARAKRLYTGVCN